jgi:ribosomal protein S18 acetylase RimI-like enzyme
VTSGFVSRGEELHLSNLGQLELLRGMTERGVPLRTAARGSSMAPFIRDRDVLTIAPLNGVDPRVGDVVAFTLTDAGILSIHRIVARTSRGWLVRGDNAAQADGAVTADQILGRVVRVERNGRDVHLGLGGEAAWLAALSRGGGLTLARTLWRLPRHVASASLRRAQGWATYRAAGRRLRLPVEIGPANAAELSAVQLRLNPFGSVPAQAPDPDVTDWVARRGGKVIGYVQYVYHPEAHAPWTGHWLFALTVWEGYRGLGVGEALTQQVLDEARGRGASELLLAVYEENKRAIRLYRKLGFEIVTLPALEVELDSEKVHSGRRRIVMCKRLIAGQAES